MSAETVVDTKTFVLVTFKPKHREERFETKEAIEDRINILAEYGIKFRAYVEEQKTVRTLLKATTGIDRLRP